MLQYCLHVDDTQSIFNFLDGNNSPIIPLMFSTMSENEENGAMEFKEMEQKYYQSSMSR